MSAPTAFGPYSFTLTDAEARVAGSRAGLRRNLAGRFERHYVAPLVAFVLAIAFIAILAFTGLIGRRLAEAALILSALAFMASRFLAHWRLHGAQKASLAAAKALQRRGETRLRIDDQSAAIESDGDSRRCVFQAGAQAEDAGGMIYLWPREGEPIFIPTRIFADAGEAARFLAFARARIAGG